MDWNDSCEICGAFVSGGGLCKRCEESPGEAMTDDGHPV